MNAEIMQFLTELKQNNNREWFQANKNRYDSLRKGFIDEVQQLINRIALFDPEIAGLEAKDCLFRIYRDIRFSPDKTPYKIHFAAYMASCGGRGSERGGYYIHLEPGGCLLSGGIWCPPPALLKALRKDILKTYDTKRRLTIFYDQKRELVSIGNKLINYYNKEDNSDE